MNPPADGADRMRQADKVISAVAEKMVNRNIVKRGWALADSSTSSSVLMLVTG